MKSLHEAPKAGNIQPYIASHSLFIENMNVAGRAWRVPVSTFYSQVDDIEYFF